MIKYYYMRCNSDAKLILSAKLSSILSIDMSGTNNFFLNSSLFLSISYNFPRGSSDDVLSDKILSLESDNFFNPS